MTIKRYSELVNLRSIEERFDYLKLHGSVGQETFGWERYANQVFYKSPEWRKIRDEVIFRDDGCDLGIPGYEIGGKILVHHMNPVVTTDLKYRNPQVLDPEFLICVSFQTHQAIHFGDRSLLPQVPIVRTPGDTKLW